MGRYIQVKTLADEDALSTSSQPPPDVVISQNAMSVGTNNKRGSELKRFKIMERKPSQAKGISTLSLTGGAVRASDRVHPVRRGRVGHLVGLAGLKPAGCTACNREQLVDIHAVDAGLLKLLKDAHLVGAPAQERPLFPSTFPMSVLTN